MVESNKIVKDLCIDILIVQSKHIITAKELATKLYNDPKLIVLDLRTKQKYLKSHIYGAIHLPETYKEDIHFKYLFDYSQHFHLVLYNNSCEINREETSFFNSTFFEFVKQSRELTQFGNRWRSVKLLENGFKCFKNSHPLYCIDRLKPLLSLQPSNRKPSLTAVIEKDAIFIADINSINVKNLGDRDCLIYCSDEQINIPDGKRFIQFKYSDLLNKKNKLEDIAVQVYNNRIDKKAVYIVCDTGYKVSTAIVISYLILQYNYTVKSAFLNMCNIVEGPIPLSPEFFHQLCVQELNIKFNLNWKEITSVVNCSLSLKFWYLSPYYELNIEECIGRVCKAK